MRHAALGGLVLIAAASGAASSGACPAPFSVMPPGPDDFIDQALAAPANRLGPLATRAMSGPFATREQAAAGCATAERLPPRPPFAAIEHCIVGDPQRGVGPDNLFRHVLVVQTPRGFWSQELAGDSWPHRARERPQVSNVAALNAADRLGDPGVEITAIAEEGPPGDAKSRRLFVCGLGPSGIPACTDIRFASGGPFHGAGSLLYRIDLDCSGTISMAGWEGGSPVRLVHAVASLAFP